MKHLTVEKIIDGIERDFRERGVKPDSKEREAMREAWRSIIWKAVQSEW